ncbi:MAG: MFS transporter [Deltaproteobacteria bacterium]|nr:MFS transporter [Deltaproteobacteria bacterium]
MEDKNKTSEREKKSFGQIVGDSLKEIGQTFVHLAKAPRALWSVNVSFFFEGLAYFGILMVLGKYLSEDVGISDLHAGWVYSIFTGGVTFMMLILGGVSDKIGVRKALLLALGMMAVGRFVLGASGTFFEYGQGVQSPMFLTVLFGLFFVMIGFGIFQPTAYAGVRVFTNKKTAAIGFAMVYAVMNLGGFFPGIISPPVRQAAGIKGVFWVYVVVTVLAFFSVVIILTRRTAKESKEKVKEDNKRFAAEEGSKEDGAKEKEDTGASAPKKSLIEPLTIAMFVAIGLGISVPIYSMVTAESPALQQALEEQAGAIDTVQSYLIENKIEFKVGDDPPPELERLREEWREATVEAERHLRAPSEQGLEVDESAIIVARAKLKADTYLVSMLIGLSEIFKPPVFEGSKAERARDILRRHSVTTMAAAYALFDPVDKAVVDELLVRLKEPSEEMIPMSNSTITEIVKLSSPKLSTLLSSLSASARDRSKELSVLSMEDSVAPLVLGLQGEALFASEVLNKSSADLGPVGREMLSEKLLSDSLVALNQARLLIGDAREPGLIDRFVGALTEFLVGFVGADQGEAGAAPSFTSVKMTSDIASSAKLATLLADAVKAPTKERLGIWTKNYGLWLSIALVCLIVLIWRMLTLRPNHPFHNNRFAFFIFVLIPVQTLFAHNWLTLPYYIDRAFGGTTVGNNFELFTGLNSLLIFILSPLIAALTARANVYKMMLWGTFVMAVPTFVLALPPHPALLLTYIILMTVGEAMWQPRFLQLVAEIAPKGKTGAYMGIAQLPWFLTKVVTGLYSGYFLASYCPEVGPQNTELMWLVYAFIAMVSPVSLLLAKRWMGSYLEKKSV